MAEPTKIIVKCPPIWAQRKVVKALTGVHEHKLRELVQEGYVRARKLSPEVRGVCVYKLSDVCDWLENDAPELYRDDGEVVQ